MIKTLTSLRFVFAMMVLSSHLVPHVHRFFYEGFVGVSFFFVLSGFVLSYSYKDKLLQKSIKKKDFYIARIARIYPLHVLTLILIIITGYNASSNPITLFSNTFLLQSFIPFRQVYFSFNAVSWSISDEMFFYLLFPFIVLPLLRMDKRVYFGLIIVFSFIIIGLNFLLEESLQHALLYISPLIRIFDFVIGIFLFKIWSEINLMQLSKRKASIFEFLAVVLFVVSLYFSKYVPIGLRYSAYYWPAISFILLIFSFQKGVFSIILSSKTLVILGEASFGLYMIHWLVLKLMKASMTSFDWPFHLGYIIIILVCILLSVISFYCFEKPMNKMVKKLSNHLSVKYENSL